MTLTTYARVVVREPRWSDVYYSVPESSGLLPGQGVLVPWGKQEKRGIILSVANRLPSTVPEGRVRPISRVNPDEPVLAASDIELAIWVSRYYRCPVGPAIRLFLPPEGKEQRGWSIRLTLWEQPVAELSELDTDATRLLDMLLERESRHPGQIIQVSAGRFREIASLDASIQALEKHGLIAFDRDVPHGKIRHRLETVYAVAGFPTPGSLPLLQAKILKALEETGRSLPARLLPGSPSARQKALRTLETAGLIKHSERFRGPETLQENPAPEAAPILNEEQFRAVSAICNAIREEVYAPFLLSGVTGSGKTEVYLHAISAALAAGKGALVIVPEIALTPQTAGRFAARFPGQVAILHSGLTPRDRHTEWWRLQRGDARVAVGTRSSLFAPVKRLGLIVVDEEHDTSFKQDSLPRYNARDTAVKKAQLLGIPVLLGSATPSLESIENARQSRYHLLKLTRRVAFSQMPQIQVVSLLKKDRRAEFDPERPWFLSESAEKAIQDTVAANEQVMVFLNRRGYAPVFPCKSCGHTPECPGCSIPLTYHHQESRLCCHYCGFQSDLPLACAKCSGTEFDSRGLGTEQVEIALKERFPNIRTARLDRDSIRKKGALAAILERFRRREIGLLVGTQILAKGHDFPGVTLVVVLNADQALRIPDFRAEERAAQLLAQVSGRAGRKDLPGRVIVQTYEPDHPVIQWLQNPDDSLWARLSEERRALNYPPFGRISTIELSGSSEADVQKAGEILAALGPLPPEVSLYGPTVPPLGRIGGRFRRRLMFKSPDVKSLSMAMDTFEQYMAITLPHSLKNKIKIEIDIDPQTLL